MASIKLARAEAHLKDAQKIAERRSGSRGAEARKHLLTAETKQAQAEQRLVRSSQEPESMWQFESIFIIRLQSVRSGIYDAQDAEVASSMLNEIQTTLDLVRPSFDVASS